MSDILPPPPPPRSSDGCWKWGAITCGVGCSLAVVAIVVLVVVFMRSPIVKNVMRSAENAQYVNDEMKAVWKKLDQYHKDKGKYPDKLAALVPTYLPEASLHFSREPNS